MTNDTGICTQKLSRQQRKLLDDAGRNVKRAIRRLRAVSMLIQAWKDQAGIVPCLVALGADPDRSPRDVAEDALGEFIFDVGEITECLHNWDRLEAIRSVQAEREAGVIGGHSKT